MKNKKNNLNNTVNSALFLAIGVVLPMFTAQIKEVGSMLLPMHFPVILCGFICGWKHGLAVGFILPLLRAVIFGMPPLFPNAVWMAAELSAYGFMSGFMYAKYKREKLWWIYSCTVASMIFGRIIWALSKIILLGIGGQVFTFEAFLAGGILNAIPGIIIQIAAIPPIVYARAKIYKGEGK